MDRSRPFERHDLVKRITALEANRSELLARAERAEAVVAALPDPNTAEELREKITELLGSPNEALVHAFLDYAWNEVARIAGWEMAARWQAEGEAKRLRAELAGASDALCAVGKAALTVAPTLCKPYQDASETSPWEQFMEQPARRAYELGARIRRELKERT